MTLRVRRNLPFSDFQREMARMFDSSRFGDQENISSGWVPAVDIVEEGDTIIVRAEIPGVKKEDIGISFENGILTIEGERAFQEESEERSYHRVERSYGRFTRAFTLPRTVDSENISANFDDGVLEISLPKREEAKPRKIEIGSSTIDTESKKSN